MAYITIDELRAYLQKKDIEQLSDDVNGTSDAEEVITPILESATDICNSYIGVRYTVPLTAPDYAIKDACAKIATYYLHLRRDWTVTETIEKAYEAAIAWLKNVAQGKAVLPIPPAGEKVNTAYFGAETRIFQGVSHDNTSDKMNGF